MAHLKLFNHYLHTPYVLLGLLELALLMIAAYFAFYVRFGEDIISIAQFGDEWFIRSLVFAIVMLASTVALGVYQARLSESFSSSAIRTVVAYCLVGTVSLTILYYVMTPLFLGRGVLFIAVMMSVIFVLPLRYLFFSIIDVERLRRRIVVLGIGKRAAEIEQEMAKRGINKNIEIVAYIEAGDAKTELTNHVPAVVSDNWVLWIKNNHIDEIVIALDERRRGEGAVFPVGQLLECKMEGVPVIEGVKFLERETGKLELDMVYPGWLLFAEGFSWTVSQNWLKRGFDVVTSFLVLALAWPLMLLTVLAVVLDSGGPVIYRQKRVGLNGTIFELLKFRSMVADAEKDGEAVWARKNDDRVTTVGKVIRNLRLDELPQLFNVLKGDMSFVGPRPERPEFVKSLVSEIPYYDMRHRVKPGLMGWAQLKYPYGASVEDASNKLRYDLYYIKNQHISLDLMIVLQSVEVILLGKGVR
jgi:sugar transferase (PEP-CTERM system associated)